MQFQLPFRIWLAMLCIDAVAFALIGVGLAIGAMLVVVLGAVVFASTGLLAVLARLRSAGG